MRPVLDWDRIVDEIDSGATFRELAPMLGYSYAGLIRRIKAERSDVAARAHDNARRKFKHPKARLVVLGWDQVEALLRHGEPTREIAKLFGLTSAGLRQKIKRERPDLYPLVETNGRLFWGQRGHRRKL